MLTLSPTYSHSNPTGMPPPSRSPGTSSSVSPFVASARDSYTTSTPHLLRHALPSRSSVDLLSRSPLSNTPRSGDSTANNMSSASSSSYSTPSGSLQLDPTAQLSLTTGGSGPPLQKTVVVHQIHLADGQLVHPEINARIDKGFFLADQDWTCYRRNYFSVACSYTLRPPGASSALYLLRANGSGMTDTIQGFSMTISAVVDGVGGKPVELVQHTPKRDKGPQGKPERVKLHPHTGASVTTFPSSSSLPSSLAPSQQGYDLSFSQPNAERRTVANFERIQFKSATANNGKRRAAQQYYHLIVELYADVGSANVKVANRVSVPMVVRGRSPGHYQDNRRGSSSSNGPGGAGGSDTGASPPNPSTGPSSGTRSMGDTMSLMGGAGSMVGSLGYQAASAGSSIHHSPSSMNNHSLSSTSSNADHGDNPVEPLIPSDGASAFEGNPVHHYYSSSFFDSQLTHPRPPHTLPSFTTASYGMPMYPTPERNASKSYHGEAPRRPAKEESGLGPSLPPPAIPWQTGSFNARENSRARPLRTPCGRFETTESSRGYYPDMHAS